MRPVSTLRLVLVGKTGVGKSSTGNSILRRPAFESGQRLKAVTTVSRLEKVQTTDVCIEIVDSPGFLEDDDSQRTEENLKEVLKSVALSLPGPHVFLLIFKGDDRFSKSEIDVCKALKRLFSDGNDDANLMQFIIIVFTKIEDKETLDEILNDPPDYLKSLLEVCCGRVVGINNSKVFGQPRDDIERLVQAALDLRDRNLGQFFSNDLVARCLQLLQCDEYKQRPLEDVKQEIQLGEDNAMSKLTSDFETRTNARNFLRCNFL